MGIKEKSELKKLSKLVFYTTYINIEIFGFIEFPATIHSTNEYKYKQ